MPADRRRAAQAAAMIDALHRRDDVLAVIGGLDEVLRARMRRLPAWDETLAKLAAEDDATLDEGLAAGRRHLNELLGFCAAAAARASRLDLGLTHVAERWLDALSDTMDVPHVALVAPSDGEFTDAASAVVNLRMPFEGVWGLGVAVHEYGHFLATRLIRRRADVGGLPDNATYVEAFLRRYETRSADTRPYYRLGHELFADAVAVWIAGPAFTQHCVEYRFDPAHSAPSGTTHPGYARRMGVQLQVLQHMGRSDASLDRAHSLLERRWRTAVPADAPAVSDDGLDEIAEFAVRTVGQDATLAHVRYRDHATAVRWASSGFDVGRIEQPSPALVLNAAWAARTIARDDMAARRRIEATAMGLLTGDGGP